MLFTRSKPVILLADDNEAVRQLAQSQLNTLGYEAETARDGEEALAKMMVRRYSALITDLRMPEMDGWELLRRMRASTIQIPTAVVTSHALTDEEFASLFRLGAKIIRDGGWSMKLLLEIPQCLLNKPNEFGRRRLERIEAISLGSAPQLA